MPSHRFIRVENVRSRSATKLRPSRTGKRATRVTGVNTPMKRMAQLRSRVHSTTGDLSVTVAKGSVAGARLTMCALSALNEVAEPCGNAAQAAATSRSDTQEMLPMKSEETPLSPHSNVAASGSFQSEIQTLCRIARLAALPITAVVVPSERRIKADAAAVSSRPPASTTNSGVCSSSKYPLASGRTSTPFSRRRHHTHRLTMFSTTPAAMYSIIQSGKSIVHSPRTVPTMPKLVKTSFKARPALSSPWQWTKHSNHTFGPSSTMRLSILVPVSSGMQGSVSVASQASGSSSHPSTLLECF
mmetsp:Transcript_63939/g.106321  ORF Transcript_63939/g.106321 Transcript_63939/m.106321 type:complete len:301 (-) Transcript_63939:98-1000(-)